MRSGRRIVVSSVWAAALVVLIPSAAAALRGQASGSATNTTGGASVTLTVSLAGNGEGWVTSYPPGISCGTICSAQFPDGTMVQLGPTPAAQSTFARWSPPSECPGGIPHEPTVCQIFLEASAGDVSVQATFNPKPPSCTVPGVTGKTLADAETALTRTHCGVGKITHAFSLKVQRGRVISQNPKAHWQREQGAKVDLVVGKGRI